MENLVTLQDLQLRDRIPAENPKVKKLRAQVPESILARFDRLVARGKKGVATVRAGVCSECHLRLSSGTLGGLGHTEEIHICDNCGRYLLRPENEPVGLAGAARPRKAGAKSLAHAL